MLVQYFNNLFYRRKILIVTKNKIIEKHIGVGLQFFAVAVLAILSCSLVLFIQKEAELYEQNKMFDAMLEENHILAENLGSSHDQLIAINDFLSGGVSAIGGADNVVEIINTDQLANQIYDKLIAITLGLERVVDSVGIDPKKLEIAYDGDNKQVKELLESFLAGREGIGGLYIEENQTAEAISGDIDALRKYTNILRTSLNKMPIASPLGKARITSGFGKRRDPFKKKSAMHNGIDFKGAHHAPIAVTADGKVIRAVKVKGYGNLVEVKHASGFSTRYAHLSKIAVKKGAKVKRGDVIGYQGNTGRSTAEHLHYEIRHNKKPINPRRFLIIGKYILDQVSG